MYKLAVCSLFCVFALVPAVSFAEVGVSAGVSVGDDRDADHVVVEQDDTPDVEVHETDRVRVQESTDAPNVEVHQDDAPHTDVHVEEHR